MNNMETPITKRVEYIDALRGVTMILVIYFHIACYSFGNDEMAYNFIIEKFRMPTFFFISGWVFYKANRIWDYNTIKEIINKKFMVQIIPFLFFMLLYLYTFDFWELSSFGSDKKGYWFTFVLFEYFVLYIGAEALLNKNNNNKGELRVMSFVLLLSIIAFYYSMNYTRHAAELGNWKIILGIFSFVKIKHFIFFWFGTFVRRHFETFVNYTNNQYFMAIVIAIYSFMIVYPSIYSTRGFEYLAYLFTGITGITIIFTFFRKNEKHFTKEKWLGNTLQFIGRRTLDIYLLHYFILPYNLKYVGDWLLQNDNKSFDMLIILLLSLWIITFSLLISSAIRLSPFLAHYLFGAKRS